MKKGITIFIIYTKSCFCIIWTPIVAQNTESLHKLWMVHSRMLVQYNNREMVLRWFLYLPSSFTLYSRARGRYKNPKGASVHNLPPLILIEIGFTNHCSSSSKWRNISFSLFKYFERTIRSTETNCALYKSPKPQLFSTRKFWKNHW